MDEKILFTLMAAVSLVLIVLLFLFLRLKRKEIKPLTPLAGLAFGCIIAGIVFGEERWLGYGLMGLGIILAVIDAIVKIKRSE